MRRTVAVVAVVGAGSACSLPTDPPELLALIPGRAFSDVPVVLRANTRNLRPALRIDARTGAIGPDFGSLGARLLSETGDPGTPPIPLEFADWTGGDAYALRLPAGIPEGTYALELTDARGVATVMSGAFTELGLDPDAPTIGVQPVTNGFTYGSGQKILAQATADDGFGFLESLDWQVGDGDPNPCLPSRDPSGLLPLALSRYTCPVNIQLPVLDATQPTVLLSFRISARDIAGHEVALNLPLKVAKLPEITSFASMSGALGGRQPFSVRGRFFLPGSEALLGGVPIIGSVLTEHDDGSATLSGFTPPRARAEPVSVEVRSPAGVTRALSSFAYLPPPRPRDIQPPAGPVRGGIRVTVRGNDLRRGFVTVFVGATRETRQPLYNVSQDSDNRMQGCLPPGSGTVSVWAYDPLTGDGELPLAFTYQDPGAGGPEPPAIDAACR